MRALSYAALRCGAITSENRGQSSFSIQRAGLRADVRVPHYVLIADASLHLRKSRQAKARVVLVYKLMEAAEWWP